jgi:hypothetical protein
LIYHFISYYSPSFPDPLLTSKRRPGGGHTDQPAATVLSASSVEADFLSLLIKSDVIFTARHKH